MKNIWIINHNATPPSLAGLCRHYYFSKYLSRDGYRVRILTASTIHNTDVNITAGKEYYCEKNMDGVPYTFLRCSEYTGNGFSRIKNMLEFPIRIWQVYKLFERPDIIYASSPDPFSAFSGLLLAKWLKVPSLLEIRDLWPESIVCYKGMSPKNLIIVTLRILEKWMYKHCDHLIFTMEGGYDYIKEHGWHKQILQDKVSHINNGVDLKEFDYNSEHFILDDTDLCNTNTFKVVYVGSIRQVNNLMLLIKLAEKAKDISDIIFLIYGDGDKRQELENYCNQHRLLNIIFKGKVDKKYVPYILSKASVNIINVQQTDIMRFGCSLNKLFDYLAAEKPIFSNLSVAHDLLLRYRCGLVASNQSAEEGWKCILLLYQQSLQRREAMGANARRVAEKYDYLQLTHRLKLIFEAM